MTLFENKIKFVLYDNIDFLENSESIDEDSLMSLEKQLHESSTEENPVSQSIESENPEALKIDSFESFSGYFFDKEILAKFTKIKRSEPQFKLDSSVSIN